MAPSGLTGQTRLTGSRSSPRSRPPKDRGLKDRSESPRRVETGLHKPAEEPGAEGRRVRATRLACEVGFRAGPATVRDRDGSGVPARRRGVHPDHARSRLPSQASPAPAPCRPDPQRRAARPSAQHHRARPPPPRGVADATVRLVELPASPPSRGDRYRASPTRRAAGTHVMARASGQGCRGKARPASRAAWVSAKA